MLTKKLKERFCKDRSLPIKVFDEPYFASRLDLFDSFYNCLKPFKMFCSLVEKYGEEQKYFEEYNRIKDEAINFLNANSAMIRFSREENMAKFDVTNKGFPSNDIYKPMNDGKIFVSIDMNKANFTALRYYDPDIVDGKETYEDFLGKFTDIDYFKQSKYIRQVIFGNMNPKRQITFERYLMDKVLTRLLERFDKSSVVFFSNDEIVIELQQLETSQVQFIEKAVSDFSKEKINVKAEFFWLEKVKGDTGAYIKHFLHGSEKPIEIKCAENHVVPFILRKLKGEESREEDFIVVYEGLLAKLMAAPNIEISK